VLSSTFLSVGKGLLPLSQSRAVRHPHPAIFLTAAFMTRSRAGVVRIVNCPELPLIAIMVSISCDHPAGFQPGLGRCE
jgi:hypothetical protein